MGKREVRVIVIRRRVTVALLVLVSAAMLSLIGLLSGKTYSSEKHAPAEELIALMQFRSADVRMLAEAMPLLADVIAFIPWGFLAFVAIDVQGRPRRRTYLLTCAAAMLFAMALVLWQYALLPTRVTTFGDTIFNLAGALLGAFLGHLRRSVRVRFD